MNRSWRSSVNLKKGAKMKQIIDAETGEIVEIEDYNEIALRTLTEVGAVTDSTLDEINMCLAYQDRFETLKYIIGKAMRENGIKKWETDDFTFTITDDTIQKRVDNDRLKEDGLYEKYLKLVPVKGSVRFKAKGRN